MRRSIRSAIVLCLVLVTVTAIVGTGFALWSFSDEHRESAQVGVYVNETVSLGKFYGKLPTYVVLEEGYRRGGNSTTTGITFYNVGKFYRDGESAALDGSDNVLYDTAFEISFKSDIALTSQMAESLAFGLKITLQDGVLSQYIRTSAWYNNKLNLIDANATQVYVDLVELVGEIDAVESGKDNFEYSQNADGTWTYTFRLTTVLLSRCFDYTATSIPDNADAYMQLVNRLASGDDTSSILFTLWQGTK